MSYVPGTIYHTLTQIQSFHDMILRVFTFIYLDTYYFYTVAYAAFSVWCCLVPKSIHFVLLSFRISFFCEKQFLIIKTVFSLFLKDVPKLTPIVLEDYCIISIICDCKIFTNIIKIIQKYYEQYGSQNTSLCNAYPATQ